ncbi:hypothetical protein [Pedococcus sp. 5OH_020]|uniref:hypothetical protein n=1 Tax=Pedococcus sp. 5OH_020 TaxID=2989814 RepID=UPI0022E9A684|nr:hypothetical protein [Pedococcus sp. 5OH_020]
MYESGQHDAATITRVVGVGRASLYRALSKPTTSSSPFPSRTGRRGIGGLRFRETASSSGSLGARLAFRCTSSRT